jgi:hypothetical protein
VIPVGIDDAKDFQLALVASLVARIP